MKYLRICLIGNIVMVLIFLLARITWAIPNSEFLYSETDLGGGLWQYDYTLFNTSDPITDAGCDLYDVYLEFDPIATFSVINIPDNWMEIDGAGFSIAFSVIPGPYPLGADIPPGDSLSSFIFQFDYQAGALLFQTSFVNPSDPLNPYIYSGISSPIPEPSTLLLLLGLVVICVFLIHPGDRYSSANTQKKNILIS